MVTSELTPHSPSLRGLSFDVWGTLLDLSPIYQSLAEILSSQDLGGVEEVLERLRRGAMEARQRRRRHGSLSIEEALEIVSSHVNVDPSVLRHVVAKVFAHINARRLVYDGVAEVLAKARRLGLRMVVLSNVLFWPGSYTRLLLARAGLLDYFHDTVFGDELGVYKPSLEAFRAAAERIDCSVEEIIHIGDRVDEDFGGALAAGAGAVLINRRIQDVVRLHKMVFVIGEIKLLNRVLDTLAAEGLIH